MKPTSILLTLPIALAQGSSPAAIITSNNITAAEQCCCLTYKASCTMNQERLFHAKLFYNRKKGITPEQFNSYWANNHTALVTPFHLRAGVVKYVQYHSTPELRDLIRPGGLPVLEFDGAAEFWVHKIETLAEMQSSPEYISKVRPDEANFIDLESLTLTVGVDYIVVDNQVAVREHGRKF